jgi:hypothetical protein
MNELDLTKIKLTSIKDRRSKVNFKSFSKELRSEGVYSFIASLPDILKGRDLKELLAAIIAARQKRKPVIWMFGAHLIKVGLAPMICRAVKRGFVQQLSTNNAGLIHDLELAFFGSTSEDVEAAILQGQFGMTRETGEIYGKVLSVARERRCGLGEAGGVVINELKARHAADSVFAVAQRLGIPATVHAAIGTDTVSAHPDFDGAAAGAASQIDFKLFCRTVTQLKNGGVALLFGSAVILPEVFLKAIAIARNLDRHFGKFTAANFDMMGLYRPQNNIVKRPRLLGATTFDFCGHHEIMLPLLWAGIQDNPTTKKVNLRIRK